MPLKRQIRLKTAIILPFVLTFLFMILAMAAVQTYRYEQTVKELSSKKLSYLTDSISQRLSDFLNRPFFANQMIAYNVGFHHLYQLNDVSRIEDFIRAAANPIGNNIQQIDVVGFGGVNGEYVGLRRDAPEQYSLMLKDARTDDKLVIYQTATKNDQLRTVIDNYDPRVRPWFAPSRRSHRHNGLRFIPIWMRSKRSLSPHSARFFRIKDLLASWFLMSNSIRSTSFSPNSNNV